MKTKQFYAGIASLSIAAALALHDLTAIKASFNDTFLAEVIIYPVTFFALMGLLLMYYGLRPIWRK